MNRWIESDEGYQWRGESGMAGTWSVRFRGVTPGLYFRPAGKLAWFGPFLGVLGLTARGLGEEGNVKADALSHAETVRERVELEFRPPGWHETTLKYTWSNSRPQQFDLLAEISTRSVGMLFGVEVGIVSAAWDVPAPVAQWLLATRDEAAAMRTIDGREPRWNAQAAAFGIDETVTGYGVDRAWPPALLRSDSETLEVLETAHPHDISRRYRSADGRVQRTWALGYDIERGIVLRARFRCRFMATDEQVDWTSMHAWQDAFVHEPLPLER